MLVTAEIHLGQGGLGTYKGNTPAGYNAFFNCRTGSVKRIFHAGLFLLHFRFGCSADIDDGHTAGQLGQAFLQFLTVIIRGGLLDLALDLHHAALDVRRFAGTFHDGGVFFLHRDPLGAAQVADLNVFQLDAEILCQAASARQDRDVFEHGLAAVAESGSLHGAALQRAAQPVDDQGRQGFAFHVLCNDE